MTALFISLSPRRGLKPSLVLCVNPAITYGLFERVKTALIARQAANGGGAEGASVELASLSLFYLGLLSKTLATVITYPYVGREWRTCVWEVCHSR